MVFTQTPGRQVKGSKSHHLIGAFTGQPIGEFDGDLEALLKFMGEEAELDAVEIGTWQLNLRRADDDAGAEEYGNEIYRLCEKYGLTIVSLACHLQGQCLGDRATLKTIKFQGGKIMAAYDDWIADGNVPAEDNPLFAPDYVAELSRELATTDLLATGRLAEQIGKLNDRDVPVSSFVGSAGAWDDIFPFPPVPETYGNRVELALKVILKRFAPVWDFYKSRGVKFGLESHPGEIAAGDITSTKRFLDATDAAGFNGTVGLNFDASHLVWQDVDPIEFIYAFKDYIWSVHHKGVQVRSQRRSRSGVFGGWEPFGTPTRYWDFVYASSDRDSTNPEEIIATLNRIGWSGAITIECEDNDFSLKDCLIAATKRLRAIDLTPAGMAFDAAFTKS